MSENFEFVGNKAKRRISKRVLQKNKARYETSIRRGRRLIGVETTLCVYWD